MSVSAAQNLIAATDWRTSKDGNLLKKLQHTLYNSIDKKHIFVHVKFESGLFILFSRTFKLKKSGISRRGCSVLFQKAEFELH
jgi:hypothetical protein